MIITNAEHVFSLSSISSFDIVRNGIFAITSGKRNIYVWDIDDPSRWVCKYGFSQNAPAESALADEDASEAAPEDSDSLSPKFLDSLINVDFGAERTVENFNVGDSIKSDSLIDSDRFLTSKPTLPSDDEDVAVSMAGDGEQLDHSSDAGSVSFPCDVASISSLRLGFTLFAVWSETCGLSLWPLFSSFDNQSNTRLFKRITNSTPSRRCSLTVSKNKIHCV